MGKKMLLWFISGVSLVIALGAVCEEFAIVDPFQGMAIVFVALLIVTRLVFDEAYQAASAKNTLFLYTVNIIASGVLFMAVLFILSALSPRLSALDKERNPDTTLFQQYQERMQELREGSIDLQAELEAGGEMAQREQEELQAKLNELQAALDLEQEKKAETKVTDICHAPGIGTEIGSVKYPVEEKYAHLRHLGPIFTASNCGENRLLEVNGGNKNYNLGILLVLNAKPTQEFLSLMEKLGFSCHESGSQSDCREWEMEKEMDLDDVLKLEPFTELIKGDDCINCG